jgi:hypothetical protein
MRRKGFIRDRHRSVYVTCLDQWEPKDSLCVGFNVIFRNISAHFLKCQDRKKDVPFTLCSLEALSEDKSLVLVRPSAITA